MRHSSPVAAASPLLCVLLLAAATALAAVKDTTGTFSKTAIDKANQTMQAVQQVYGKEMVVEVFASIPADLRQNYSRDRQDAFFTDWARPRARELNINGIYVLVCRDPGYLKVLVGRRTQERAFTAADEEQLKTLMLNYFQQHKFDEGLLAGVDFVQRTMQAHLGQAGSGAAKPTYQSNLPNGRSSSPPHTSFGWLGWIILGGGVLVLMLWLLRRGSSSYGPAASSGPGYRGPMEGYPPPGYSPGVGYPSSGGGFGRGMLGGLLGGLAGGWLYDRFGNRDPAPPQAWGNDPASSAQPPASDVGGDYSGPGLSFDDASSTQPDISSQSDDFSGGDNGGGGNSGGGGDFGGGDSGGGDSGSGGSF